MTTKRFILLMTLALTAGMMHAQDPVEIGNFPLAEDTLLASADTLTTDTVESIPDPEWYVAPISYDSVMARHKIMRRAASNTCPIDSVLTFNVDSVLTDVSIYEYGDTTRTITWAINPDGSRVGKAKTEEGTNGNITFSATYSWDNTTNNWKGTEKTEQVYDNGKQISKIDFAWDNTIHDWCYASKDEYVYNAKGKMESRTISSWVNNEWEIQTKYTYAYDASNREIEFYTYVRDAGTGQLVYSKCRLQTWYDNSRKTLEINYTAYTNGAWSAGTQKEWFYDAKGNQTGYNYYSTYENGSWINSTHEVWEYNASNKNINYEQYTWYNGTWVGSYKESWAYNTAGKITLHEKFGWTNNDWTVSLREKTGYDEAGNTILVENYSVKNGVLVGSKKEEYTYNPQKKRTVTVWYQWSNNDWVKKNKSVTDYDAAGNNIETANYNWSTATNDWIGTGTRTLQTFNGNKKVIEKITQYWSTIQNNWENKTRNTTEYSGTKTTQEASYTWSTEINDWIGTSRSDWHYNAAGQNDTITVYAPNGTEWLYYSRTVSTYDSHGNNILTHNALWDGVKWGMVSMTRLDAEYDTAGRQTLNATYSCEADSVWKGIQKDTTVYSLSGKTLYTIHYASWVNNNWLPSYKLEYEYDEADRNTLEQRLNWSQNNWVGSYKFEYGYDVAGRKVKEAQYIWASNAWKGMSRTDKEYDAVGNEIFKISYSWQNNKWVGSSKESNVYDDKKRKIEYLLQLWQNGEWVNNRRRTNTYDAKGQNISAHQYMWLNNQWVYTSVDDKIYDEADNKLRRETFGTWNNGVVQSYTDNLYFYDCDHPYYTISFDNYDGSLLQSYEVKETKKPVYKGETPTKPANDQYAYTFKGWDKPIVAATEDAHYIAVYDSVANKYTITWQNDDGSLIDETEVAYGITPTHDNPTKPSTAEYSYIFAGWTPEVVPVTGNATYRATFTQVEKGWVITWQDETGAQIDQTIVKTGVVPTHEDLAKEATAEYTYTFTGWTPTIVAATEDATYRATFSATKNSYTITWRNWDNSQIDQTTVEYGVTPTHDDPTRERTAQYTYSFKGWTPNITAVTSATTYTAEFDSTVNIYTAIFSNYNGDILQTLPTAYGVTPQYTGETPEKPANAQYTYTFKGWTPALAEVTGDATYTADFDSVAKTYTIRFVDEDNTELQSSSVEYGQTPVYTGSTPEKESTAEFTYSFAGWMPEIVSVTADATYTATYTATKRSYTIIWLDSDDTQIEQQTLEYGTTPSHEAPVRENTAEYSYVFLGWTPEIATVTGNVTYTALFSVTKNSYTITWLNLDNSLIEQQTLEYGLTPTHEAPVKENTAQYTYSFAGWTPDIVAVSGDATYTAQFDSTVNKYPISFLNYDGAELQKSSVEFGQTPAYTGATPVKPNTAQYTYSFKGWTPEIVAVSDEATYTAQFDSVINSYTITWQDENGAELSHETLAYGATPSHDDPVKTNTAEFTYAFTGWTPQIAAVTGDATYRATFSATKNKYAVSFLNYDGTELQNSSVEFGQTPAYTGATPSKPATAQYTYTFTGWTPQIASVSGEATYTAQYDSVINSYTVIFYYEDGYTELDRMTLQYGETPSTVGVPSKLSDVQYTYHFAGWSPELAPVTGDVAYTPVYDTVLNQYPITFKNDNGRVLKTVMTDYGTIPEYTGETPDKPATAQYSFIFAGWTPELTEVTGAATYTAIFESELNSYTITFFDEDGTQLDQVIVEYGTMPTTDVIPTKPEDEEYTYTFAGWTPRLVKVTSDASYWATYTATKKTNGLSPVTGNPSPVTVKVLIDGTIYIRRGSHLYTLDGVLVE